MRRRIFFLIFTLFFILSGCSIISKNEGESTIKPATGEKDSLVNLVLYFPDNHAEYLVAEERFVPLNNNLERTIAEEILKGPDSPLLSNPIPKGTKLLSIEREGDTVTLNLSKEFIDNHPGGSTGEIMSIYPLVNSLTELPGVGRVIFKVKGKSYETLKGHIVFNEPFTRDRKLFKRDKALNPTEVLTAQMNYEKQGEWLKAYTLMSDEEGSVIINRKYYHDYVKEMEEVAELGFTDQEFKISGYTLNEDKDRARVKVNFYTRQADGSLEESEDIFFNCVKVGDSWMVDWLTVQE